MNRRLIFAGSGLVVLAAAVLVALRGGRGLPPLGVLLDPANGVWAAARAAEAPVPPVVRHPAFDRPVEVVVDDRGVPHIYAESELDAFRALGFWVARDRLFQMELQTRAAAGTLTELLGRRALGADREARALGFGRMVEARLAGADTSSAAFQSMRAYAEGVNARIESLRASEVPIEYRLLGTRPARWSVANTYYLLARMALTLADNDISLAKARAAARIGWPAANALYPVNAPIQEPIQPGGADSTRFAFVPLPPPGPADSTAARAVAIRERIDPLETVDGGAVGSNNWAVAPGRSATKHALLAGDPHLELTLPSIWYQAHLVVPDRLDVAGVTLPGAPWIVIGFNRDIAWSFTNTGSDVNDYYLETVDQPDEPARYRLDGAWQPLESRIETFRGVNGEVLGVDTVRFTHRGPLRRVDSVWVSMAWTVYRNESNGAEFLAMNRARSVSEFLEVTAGYVAPAQNMVVADRAGSVAIRSTGRYPIRPGDGRGDLIRDGSSSSADWIGAWPVDSYPFSRDPARGFLSSANQQPIDPQTSARYLGAGWPSPWRAIRINQLLRADTQVTVDAMRRYQTDPGSARADLFLPLLIGARIDSSRLGSAASRARESARLLAQWNRRYEVSATGAVLFEAIMAELGRLVWDELAAPSQPPGERPLARPADAILLGLFRDSASAWWDDRNTELVERRDDVVARALAAGLDSAMARHGPPGSAWEWGKVHGASIRHLLGLAPFSATGLPVASGPSTLSPSAGSGGHGASWRMVVELGPDPTAWGVYPGGQSGNPLSRHYRDFIPAWREGRLDSLVWPRSAPAFPAERIESRVTFDGGR